MVINLRLKQMNRFRQILQVFAKHGFGRIIDQLKLSSNFGFKLNKSKLATDENEVLYRLTDGERLRLSLEELGPTFVKLGQIISTRPDLIPPDIITELEKLQTSVPPFPFDEVKSIVENEFDDKFEMIFKEFQSRPIASASIAQVHHAKLNSGKAVVVKIQRPGIEERINLDLEILANVAAFIDNHTKYGKLYSFTKMVEEFKTTINNELDFRMEGENAEKFKEYAKQDKGIKVPEISWVHTTKRVLTMEFIDGIQINDFAALDQAGLDRGIIARNLATSLLNQILRDGFFHGDPHPGNILILTDNTIVFLDLGMVGKLNDRHKALFIKMLMGIAFKNTRLISQAIIDLDVMAHQINIKKLEKDIDIMRDKYLSLPLTEINIGEAFNEIFSLAFSYHIVIPSEFTMLGKALVTLEGLVGQLAPDMNVFEIAEPIAKRLMFKTISIQNITEDVFGGVMDLGSVLKKFPAQLHNYLQKFENDNFAFNIQLKGFEQFEKRNDKIFGRLSLSIVVLALCVIIAGIFISIGVSGHYVEEFASLSITLTKALLLIVGVLIIGLVISVIRSFFKR